MRRFHNWIKRHLLNSYSTKSGQLLDLACGKGGDIFKWVDNNIRYVEGYDINKDSIEEAKNRFNKVVQKPTSKNFNYTFNVKDLSNELIETDIKFDIVTSFFAIHYFYKNEITLNTFLKNLEHLKDNGYFIITTLCSEKLKQINYNYHTDYLQIQKKDENLIDVYIKDTVLNEATEEYIVDKDYTIDIMQKMNYKLIDTRLFSDYYADWKQNNNFLSKQEQEYSFLNRVYIFQKQPKTTIRVSPKKVRNSPLKAKMHPERQAQLHSVPQKISEGELLLNRPIKGKNAWTLKELKEYCIKNGLDSKGIKEQLITRIQKTVTK